MDFLLDGKVALVTGASRGIGRAIARVLSEEGVRLVLAARSSDDLHDLSSSLPAPSVAWPTDLRDPEAPGLAVAEAVARYGSLDLLINNAGATKRGDFLTLTESDWTDGYALKFFGAVRASCAAWPHLRTAGGSIVNVVGIGGRTAKAEFTIGGSVNAALLNLTKALADRGVRDGVRVNAVNPSSISTERLQARIEALAAEREISLEAAREEMASALGVPRFGEPVEVARAVAWLASPLSSYCQGAILDVDGGQTRTL